MTYLIQHEGDINQAKDALVSFLQERGVKAHENPDVLIFVFDKVSVEDAREITKQASFKNIADEKHIAIVTNEITPQAQDALLKTLEDSPDNVIFYVFTEDKTTLRPTLLSRLTELNIKQQGLNFSEDEFLKLSLTQRLDYVSKIKDRREALLFCKKLLENAQQKSPEWKTDNKTVLNYLLEAHDLYKQSSYPTKNLLELFALLYPKK